MQVAVPVVAFVGSAILLALALFWPIAPDPAEHRVFEYRNVRRLTPKDIRDYTVDQGHLFFDWQIHDVEVW